MDGVKEVAMSTDPSYYFALEGYVHAPLFKGVKHAWEALGRLKDYLEGLCQSLSQEEIFEAYRGVYWENPRLIRLGKDVTIEQGAYIEGPCFIGDGTVIRHGAYVRRGVVTGSRCIIGHGTEIKQSILFDDVRAAHFNYVGDSILGNSVNLGAGVKCANLRLDKGNIFVRLCDEKWDTGRNKLGAIIGDKCQVGCNTVLNPGVILSPKVLCPPCQNISKSITT